MRMTPKADYFLKANIHYIPTPPLYYQKDIKPKHTTIWTTSSAVGHEDVEVK